MRVNPNKIKIDEKMAADLILTLPEGKGLILFNGCFLSSSISEIPLMVYKPPYNSTLNVM